jgi:uncharacterized protein YjbI with pentapeptide repeats
MGTVKVEIKSRLSGAVLFAVEVDASATESRRVGMAVIEALKQGADLRSANLRGANLYGADLRSADLRSADLRSANLYGADLRGADLRSADLRSADLRSADLEGADLEGANLYGADLRSADLRSADLEGEILKQTPVTISNLRWWVLISDSYLRIGCQRHLTSEWRGFSDEKIASMDSDALEFWTKYKTAILALCDAHQSK